jgi:hypothetical protein
MYWVFSEIKNVDDKHTLQITHSIYVFLTKEAYNGMQQ